jgi:lysophospholipase L1-like esterase
VNQIGQVYGVAVVDLWSKVVQQATPNGTGDFLIDGLHLNANGYKASSKIGMTKRH